MNKNLLLILLILPAIAFGQQGSKEIISQIDKPAGHRQLSYSPEDGSIATFNPPLFIWVPVKQVSNNFVYTIKISK